MGGKTYRAIFLGGKRTIERAFQNQFGGLRKWDLPGLRRFPLRKTTGRKQTGGKTYHRWGVKNRFWEGILWYVFPSPEFSTPPLFFSEIPNAC